MFSALSPGSPIYLLDKTSTPKYFIGEVVGVTVPNYLFGLVNLKIKLDGDIREFNNIPAINTFVTYNNGNLIISETKLLILNEVESILHNSRTILENIDSYLENINECESILKTLNPQFAKDKELEERLGNLELRFDGVESKLDEIFKFIKTK